MTFGPSEWIGAAGLFLGLVGTLRLSIRQQFQALEGRLQERHEAYLLRLAGLEVTTKSNADEQRKMAVELASLRATCAVQHGGVTHG